MPLKQPISTRTNDSTRERFLYRGEAPQAGYMTSQRLYTSDDSPTASNDSRDSAGIGVVFQVGDFWNCLDDNSLYFCTDSSQGAAVWMVSVSAIGGKIVQTVSSATATLDGTSEFIAVSYTATGAVALTMPLASTFWDSDNSIGFELTVADTGANASLNNITVTASGSDTIITDVTAQTSVVISGDGVAVRFIAINSTTWKVW